MSNFYDLETDLEVEDVNSGEEYENEYEAEEEYEEYEGENFLKEVFPLALPFSRT